MANSLPFTALFGVVSVFFGRPPTRLLVPAFFWGSVAAAQGTGVPPTDHYHRPVKLLADAAYVLWKKQCVPLDGAASVYDQHVDVGFLWEKSG